MLAGNAQHKEADLLLQIIHLPSDWRGATLFHFPEENAFLFNTCVSAHLSQHRPKPRGTKKMKLHSALQSIQLQTKELVACRKSRIPFRTHWAAPLDACDWYFFVLLTESADHSGRSTTETSSPCPSGSPFSQSTSAWDSRKTNFRRAKVHHWPDPSGKAGNVWL